MKPQVSIIYVYYNTPLEIIDSINSIKQAIGKIKFEIIIVNNNSPLPLPKLDKKIRIINSKNNLGFAKGVNMANRVAKGNFLLVTNPDTVFSKDSITEMVKKINSDKTIGAIGPKMVDMNNKTLPTISGSPLLPNALFAFSFIDKIWPGNYFSEKYWMRKTKRTKELSVDIIGGACFCMRKVVFDKISGLDERFFMYFEEADLFLRVKKLGLKVIFFPKAKIVHFVGRSNRDKEQIQQMYEKSRYKLLEKYHGKFLALIAELFLRTTKINNLALITILAFSLFLNLYNIQATMLFIGDSARDYLAARDMILNHTIPLVGIPSSVVWLHQGPTSIYIIGIAFLLSNFNPIAPAVLYGTIGVLATFLVYKLGSLFFGKNVGLLSSLFYATSPLVIVNARMPYHTSAIPVFVSLVFLILYKIINGEKKLLFLLFLSFGLLLQVELSNAIFILVFLVCFIMFSIRFGKKDLMFSLGGFIFGVVPFILYDITHKFVYTVGFPLWTINRVRLFLGIASAHSTSANTGNAVLRIYQQSSSLIFAADKIISLVIIGLIFVMFILNLRMLLKNKGIVLIVLWLIIPVLGFLIHTSPGTAYFPALFPALSILIGFTFYFFSRYSKVSILLIAAVCLFNAYFTVKNEYFISNLDHYHTLPPFSYNLGRSLSVADDVTKYIIKSSNNKPVNVVPGGFISKFPTSVDSYKYLIWYKNGKLDSKGKKYVIYEDKKQIPTLEKIKYENKYIFVTQP